MTVQIDDAGWGCLAGGTIIGAYRVETGQFVWGEIPVEYFQGEEFRRQQYLSVGGELARHLLDQLEAGKEEQIEICTGHVLEGIRNLLDKEGYSFHPTKITGPLQEKIEGALLDNLKLLGIETDYETVTKKQGLLFWQCVKWLKGGNVQAARALPEREARAKTGWSTYSIWANHPYNEAKQLTADFKRERKRVSNMEYGR